jgi:hypothetical protein
MPERNPPRWPPRPPRGREPIPREDPPSLPPERMRERLPSVHDVEELQEQVRDLEYKYEEIKTGSHFVPPPGASRTTSPTSTPPQMRWVQRRIGSGVLKAIGVAALTTITVVVTSAVKDCQASAERHIIEMHQAAPPGSR